LAQSLGRFHGDALGNPARLIGSPGHAEDIAFAHDLVEGFLADVMIAGKGYDAGDLCDRITASPPSRSGSNRQIVSTTWVGTGVPDLLRERATSDFCD